MRRLEGVRSLRTTTTIIPTRTLPPVVPRMIRPQPSAIRTTLHVSKGVVSKQLIGSVVEFHISNPKGSTVWEQLWHGGNAAEKGSVWKEERRSAWRLPVAIRGCFLANPMLQGTTHYDGNKSEKNGYKSYTYVTL